MTLKNTPWLWIGAALVALYLLGRTKAQAKRDGLMVQSQNLYFDP